MAPRRLATRITYSPKVFIPLTQLCRNSCGYCTFAQPPARLDRLYLAPDDVLGIARRGAAAGCHEALFTLGERPEDRYPSARAWLALHGYDSTVAYLVEMCRRVVTETGMLPHVNAGALTEPELLTLRKVAASQGMMLETLREDLACHRHAPDKAPERRLSTLEAAGRLAIPFTTGILVGIGEDEHDRVKALEAIAASHEHHRHVQEVIVQNFIPKPGTAMRDTPPCPPDVLFEAIRTARTILPPDVHVQAPPNLTQDIGALLDAGIDDFGGISPVTIDHVNPDRAWPEVERLGTICSGRGLSLAPRLTLYPEYALDPIRWLDPALTFAVLDRSDAEGLARDDPGVLTPNRTTEVRQPSDGAEVKIIGRRSTTWCAGGSVPPPVLLPGTPKATGAVHEVLQGVEMGQEPGVPELTTLFSARGNEVAAVAQLADRLRAQSVGDAVTFVKNRNINYTNICTFKCQFCGFSKGPLSLNLRGRPYLLTMDDIALKAREAWASGATEVCLQGGIHPAFDGDYYLAVCAAVRDAAPGLHIHGFTALEVTEGARRLGEPLACYLRRLREAGLASLPGTAAEILDDSVREILCPDKVSTDEWLDCHREAHRLGLSSNVTMMFGAVEHPVSWARHLVLTRDLQKETGGFTEFVGLPFVHMASPIYLARRSRRGPTFREVVLVHAVARIAYHGLIDHIQVSWVKVGLDGAAQLLRAGVDDLGGTLMDENISRAAGASHGRRTDEDTLAALATRAGRPLEQRTTLYGRVAAAAC